MNAIVTSWFCIREGDLGLWLAAYLTTAVRGRYRAVFIGTAITAYIPWLVLPSGGRGARTIEIVIVVMFWPLRVNEPRVKHGRDEFGF